MINAFFQAHIVGFYFIYGLTFFSLGLTLAVSCRRGATTFRFAKAIRPLVFFGFFHAANEWIEMFQFITMQTQQIPPTVTQESIRLAILAASFLCLLAFGMLLLSPAHLSWRHLLTPLAAGTGVWLAGIIAAKLLLAPSPFALTQIADVLARYSLAIPGALLATWALMRQQRTFRERGMPHFGRYLVWAAMAMLLYGVVGQMFGRETMLAPSNVLNSHRFMTRFGFPVLVFQVIVAVVFTFFLSGALNAFEVEREQQLEAANQERARAQQEQIDAEKQSRLEMEQLNNQLLSMTRELGLLLDLANILVAPILLENRLHLVLEELMHSVSVSEDSLILLVDPEQGEPTAAATVGFQGDSKCDLYEQAVHLGRLCIAKGHALCRRLDGAVLEYHPAREDQRQACMKYPSPMIVLSLPLLVQESATGCLVFAWPCEQAHDPFSADEFNLVFAATQQLGLSIEHARLNKEAQEREDLLGNLLHQIVGAQEEERKRIARELHDSTAQYLTALSLGLRGTENVLKKEPCHVQKQIHELGGLSTQALAELRQLIADLRPSHLDDLGLVPTILWYLKQYEQWHEIQTHLEIQGDSIRLPAEHEIVLFRIVQEALTNVVKHAVASQVWVRCVFTPHQVALEVEDNGKGFDPQTVLAHRPTFAGWGLVGMQERVALLNGRVEFNSTPGQGTCIRVTVPFAKENSNDP